MKFEDIFIHDEVIVTNMITKKKSVCRVIDKSIPTREILVVLSEGRAIWVRAEDVDPYK